MINHKNEYSRSHEREFDNMPGIQFKRLDIPAILGLATLLAICVFGLVRFWK